MAIASWIRSLFYDDNDNSSEKDAGRAHGSPTQDTMVLKALDVVHEGSDEDVSLGPGSDKVKSGKLRKWVVNAKDLFNRCLVEFTACMMFHFLGSVSPTPWTNGIALMVLVYYTAKISGAHLNPSVSLVFCLLGHTDPTEMMFYWFAQVGGCIAGALWIAGLVPGLNARQAPRGIYKDLSGCFTPDASLTGFQVFAWEAVNTCCFVVPIFSVVWYTQNKKGYGNTGPLIVGLSLMVNALACGQFTGASFNPARSLGSPAVFVCPYGSKVYIYVLSELTGAAFATVAIVPWYGISRNAWYGSRIPTWAYLAAKNNHQCIVIETVNEADAPLSQKISLITPRYCHSLPRSLHSSQEAFGQNNV